MQKYQQGIKIGNHSFYHVYFPDMSEERFLVQPGEIYICDVALEKFEASTFERRIQAHCRREVGEYNQWLMTDEEKSDINYFFQEAINRMEHAGEKETVEQIKENQGWFWESIITEDKDLENIENDMVIESYFMDGMVILSTPRRKATIIYLEKNMDNIDHFYQLDQSIESGEN